MSPHSPADPSSSSSAGWPPALRPLLTAIFVVLCCTHAFIDLEVAQDLPLPGGRLWAANAPVSDLVGLGLLVIVGPLLLFRSKQASAPPGWTGWALLVLALTASSRHAIDPAEALHFLLRKPVLVYLIYGVGVATTVHLGLRSRTVRAAALGGLGLTAAVSLVTSAGRIVAGDALWFHAIAHLTPNHKTLAVCLAGWLPLLWTWAWGTGHDRKTRRVAMVVSAACLLAIALSMSKTAWLGTGLSLALSLPRHRPLAWRPRSMLPVAVLAVALAYYLPVLMQSRTMLDAARARHSLNTRAWQMFAAHPLVGSGGGMSTEIELVTFPDYRINGVDAHGALQKVASEAGLVGLSGLLLFVTGSGRRLYCCWKEERWKEERWKEERWKEERSAQPATDPLGLATYGSLATFVVLCGLLLLSTELYSPTHWLPLAVAWGLSMKTKQQGTLRSRSPCAS